MIGRLWIKQRAGGLVLGLCTLVAAGGCGHTERIVHGREFLESGPLQVSSLGPTCGCISLRNKSSKSIMLESSFYGISRGTVFLSPEERTRVLFDWGGPENSDYYLIDAYEVDPTAKNQRGARLIMSEVVSEYAPFVDTPCDDKACNFNGLAMNRMMDDAEELERENPTRGVNFTSVISVSAPANECGCLMLTNFSDHDLTLRATLHGAETGQVELRAGVTVPVTFDWAGTLDTDTYIIDAVDVRTPGDAPRSGNASAKAPTTADAPSERPGTAMTIRLKDHVKIDGTLVNMACQADYAEFINQKGTPNAETAVRCPWKPQDLPGLGMRVAYDKRSQTYRNEGGGNSSPAPPKPQQ